MKTSLAYEELAKNEFNLKFLHSILLEDRFVKSFKFFILESLMVMQYEIRVYAETMLDTVKNGANHSCSFF